MLTIYKPLHQNLILFGIVTIHSLNYVHGRHLLIKISKVNYVGMGIVTPKHPQSTKKAKVEISYINSCGSSIAWIKLCNPYTI